MPLIVLIAVYAISTLGFVLIPGVDDQGQPWSMGFFHAFYFVSFMGSTIGFGEVPYPFTDAQRMWTLVGIYATVLAWLYAIGSMLGLLQDKGFLRLLKTRQFAQHIKHINDPFYLVCGYGTTGRDVVHGLEKQGYLSVVLDIKQDRIDALELEDFRTPMYGLCADAAVPENLDLAGMQHPNCKGVLALTNDDNVNLSVSIASKLLYQNRSVVSRSENSITTANLESFGTDLIVDPFKQFADYLGLAAHSPQKHLIIDWLMYPDHRPIASTYKHKEGRWLLCGFGRFGQALAHAMRDESTALTLIDPSFKKDPEASLAHQVNVNRVSGIGTEANTLLEAGVESAVGVIAGTGNDADNLSIIMTARELNPSLMTVVRQNRDSNTLVFDRLKADFVMNPGRIIAAKILSHLRTPLLAEYFDHALTLSEVDARELIQRIQHTVGDDPVECVAIEIGVDTPAVMRWIEEGRSIAIRSLLKSPSDRRHQLKCLPLMFKRGDHVDIEPGELTDLELGDHILFCGVHEELLKQTWLLDNDRSLRYVLTGDDVGNSVLHRLLNGVES